MRLTEISVRALKGSDTYTTYFDDTLPGFGIRVGKRSRTFIVLRGKQRQRVFNAAALVLTHYRLGATQLFEDLSSAA
jgi:hypothetical protein